jgi:hypothetical protein
LPYLLPDSQGVAGPGTPFGTATEQ